MTESDCSNVQVLSSVSSHRAFYVTGMGVYTNVDLKLQKYDSHENTDYYYEVITSCLFTAQSSEHSVIQRLS